MSHHVAVIGAGPGGYAAAFYAADLGMKVTLIDNEKNPGRRVPVSRLHPVEGPAARREAARGIEAREGVGHRVRRSQGRLDKLRDFKNRVVDKLTSGTGQVSKFRKVNYIQGWASIVDPKTIEVKKADGDRDRQR